MDLTAEELDKLFVYDIINGGLIRLKSVSKNTSKGDVVGRPTSGNYVSTTIKGIEHQIHRIVYMLFYGYLPDFIDHKDGNPLNNRIDNLRPCTNSQNQYNKKVQKNNTSGYKNVYKKGDKWIVMFRMDGRLKSYGVYATKSEAVNISKRLRIELHGSYARHE